MLTSLSSQAILTKIKAMYGSRITRQNYAELLRKRTVGEVAGYLKNETHYRSVLASTQESLIHRGQLENLIRMETYMRYQRLLNYDKNPNSFYQYVIYSLEINEIINCLKIIHTGKSGAYLSSLPTYLEKRMDFSLIDLAKSTTFPEMLRLLEKTPYKRLLEPYLPPRSPEPHLSACEQAMRKFYYQRIEDMIMANYHGKTAKELRTIYQTQAELNNITSIYRLKRFFDVPPDKILHSLVPVKGRIPIPMWKKLVEAPTGDDFMKMLASSPYAKYMDSDFLFIEYTTHTIRYYLNKRYINYSTSAPVVFAAFMVLSGIERENLVNIIEGIRYGLPAEEIEKLLIQ